MRVQQRTHAMTNGVKRVMQEPLRDGDGGWEYVDVKPTARARPTRQAR
jgi:hypothetical protein